MKPDDVPRIDKTVFRVASSFEEADRQDADAFARMNVEQRWETMEIMRRLTYGDAIDRPRVLGRLTVLEQPWSRRKK